MSIITISSDSYQVAGEIAEKTADNLNYTCLGREILGLVAEKHNVPEKELVMALDSIPSFLGISGKVRNRYLAHIEAAVLNRLLDDNTVCYGLAAHLYLTGVSHVLKVSIISDPKELVRAIASEKHISPEKAEKLIKQREKQRRRRSLEVFHVDETDALRYDLVINLGQIDKERAIGIIMNTINDRKFKAITYSLNCMEDIDLSVRVKEALLEDFPGVTVNAKRGTVVVETKVLKHKKRDKTNTIKEIAAKIPGVAHVEVYAKNYISRKGSAD